MKYGSLSIHGRVSGIVSLVFCFVVVCAASSARAQNASIGIYSDAERSGCSLTDPGSGVINAYVVVNSQAGATGLRFSVPKPECFSGTWLADEVTTGYFAIGQSPDDITIALGTCVEGPRHVLTIMFHATGATPTCCELPVVAASEQTELEVYDCAFGQHVPTATSGYFNGDETCGCAVINLPPSTPAGPSPDNGAFNVGVNPSLNWQSTDPEGQAVTFDVHFGMAADPPLVASDLAAPPYDPGTLEPQTTYYWKIVAADPGNHTAEGPVWSFTTGGPGGTPPMPINPVPEDGATDRMRKLQLTWSVVHNGAFVVDYTVHFGDTPTPPSIGNTPFAAKAIEGLELDKTYYWYVVVNGDAVSTQGPLWSFHTIASNPPPSAPSLPLPADNAMQVSPHPNLAWYSTDPEGQALSYNVYFGTDPAPPFFAHTTNSSKLTSGLADFTDYYWRVVAVDADDDSTSGPVWKFTTGLNQPPSQPSSPIPSNGQTFVVPTGLHLKWSATDPAGDPLSYAVYLGTTNPPPLLIASTPSKDLPVDPLANNTQYYWKVIAKEIDGLTTEGPVWSFTTRTVYPPTVPANPSPPDGAIDVNRMTYIGWDSTDPDDSVNLMRNDIYLGTDPDPPFLYFTYANPTRARGPLLFQTLEIGKTYYWKVVVTDDDGASTTGPIWSFTTTATNLPPEVPHNPTPPDAATGQPRMYLLLDYETADPENVTLRKDTYFGTTNPPPLVSENQVFRYAAQNLMSGTTYYWRAVVRDVDGNETSGPVWSFRTSASYASQTAMGLYSDPQGSSCSLADQGPGVRNFYVVLDGPQDYLGAGFKAAKPDCFNATWVSDSTPYSYHVTGRSEAGVWVQFGEFYNCRAVPHTFMTITYLSAGTTSGCCEFPLQPHPSHGLIATTCQPSEPRTAINSPVLKISSDGSCAPCVLDGFLRFAEAEDTCRIGTTGTTTYDLELNPATTADGGSIDVTFSPSLTFVSCERGDLSQSWTSFDYSVNGHTITISGTADPGYDPASDGVFARLTFESDCCQWSSPAQLAFSNAQGDFVGLRLLDKQLTCRLQEDGDVNGDGTITVSDAQCALDGYLYAPSLPPSGCGGPDFLRRADVDCSGRATPADAYCIFRRWLDQSCSFCNGQAQVARTPSTGRMGLRIVREIDDVIVVMQSRGIDALGSLGFELVYPEGIDFVGIEAANRDAFAALRTRIIAPGRLRVGAYVNGAPVDPGDGDMFAIRLRVPDRVAGHVSAVGFVDDLAGVDEVSASLDGGTAPALPNRVVLHQNSPNPFNPVTSIRFELPEAMHVRVAIYDVRGAAVRTLVDERRSSGAHLLEWDGSDARGDGVATGVYFYVLEAGGKRYQHKMVLLK